MNKDKNSKFIFNWVLVNKISIGTPLKSEKDVFKLKEKKINSILSLCSEDILFKNFYNNFNHKTYVLPDHRDGICPNKNQIKMALKIIEESLIKGPIFIHCEAAVERSPLICIAWLIFKESIPFDHAIRYLKDIHPNSNPHFEQLNVLKNDFNK